MKLSIVVITMNRAEQLCTALLSCINSKLPDKTEFVIVDNASTDNTEEEVKTFFAAHPYPYIYEKESVNRGVGGGRNRGFELANGDYVYFLDDDAVISPESYETFFKLPLSLFQHDESVASITTRIYDELIECDRGVAFSKKNHGNTIPEIFMYLGGSHFLRREYYDTPLYLDFKYGLEELVPSIYAIDKGLKNCYLHQIKILHQPKRNKWMSGTDERNRIVMDYNVNNYVSKRLIYPSFFAPMLFVAFVIRTVRYFGMKVGLWNESAKKLKSQINHINTTARKVRLKTVFTIMKSYSVGTAI